jgi:exocyst complex component 4
LNPIVGSLVTVKNLIGGAFKGVTAASSNQVVRDATERFIIFYIREHKESSKLADESEFMWEQSAYSTLASMIESLNWVQSRLVELSEPLSGYQSRVETLKLAGSKGSSIDFSKMMTDSITYLVERCLSTLRIEIRCHLLYFLTNIRTSSYYCDEEPTKPEKFVADSNRDLMRIDEKISRYLNPETKKKIFSGIPFVISHLVMEGLSKLSDKRINKNGVLKMSRNLFAMQQTLINILSASDDRIDRARQYWEILLEENTLEFTKSHPELFTPEEYRALLQINFIHEKPLHT